MSYLSLLTSLCTISEEVVTTNAVGQEIRSFSNATQVKCKLDPFARSGNRDDIDLGRIIVDNTYTLFLPPDAVISKEHKVALRGVDYRVNRVNRHDDARGNVHHYEVDVQDIG